MGFPAQLCPDCGSQNPTVVFSDTQRPLKAATVGFSEASVVSGTAGQSSPTKPPCFLLCVCIHVCVVLIASLWLFTVMFWASSAALHRLVIKSCYSGRWRKKMSPKLNWRFNHPPLSGACCTVTVDWLFSSDLHFGGCWLWRPWVLLEGKGRWTHHISPSPATKDTTVSDGCLLFLLSASFCCSLARQVHF